MSTEAEGLAFQSLWEGGVPRCLDELRRQGYHSVTVNPGHGLTLLCPIVGGTPFMEVLTEKF